MPADAGSPIRGAILAMTRDRVIGLDGKIPWHYSEDLKRFKRVTMGSTIVMGRLTWESIGSKPLPGRHNIVISRNPVAHVEYHTSVERALAVCNSDTWIIGGGQIYAAAMHWVDKLDVTWVPDSIEDDNAVLFPEIDPDIWKEVSSSYLPGTELLNVIYCRN